MAEAECEKKIELRGRQTEASSGAKRKLSRDTDNGEKPPTKKRKMDRNICDGLAGTNPDTLKVTEKDSESVSSSSPHYCIDFEEIRVEGKMVKLYVSFRPLTNEFCLIYLY